MVEPEDSDLILRSVVGAKSPNIVFKCANALTMIYRLHSVHFHGDCISFDEIRLDDMCSRLL